MTRRAFARADVPPTAGCGVSYDDPPAVGRRQCGWREGAPGDGSACGCTLVRRLPGVIELPESCSRVVRRPHVQGRFRGCLAPGAGDAAQFARLERGQFQLVGGFLLD